MCVCVCVCVYNIKSYVKYNTRLDGLTDRERLIENTWTSFSLKKMRMLITHMHPYA